MTKDILKQKFSEYDFLKVVNEKERGNSLFDVTIIYPHNKKLDEKVKYEITTIIKELHKDKDVRVEFKKSFLDNALLAEVVMNYLTEHYFVICDMIKIEDAIFDDDVAKISFTLNCDTAVEDYIRNKNVIENLKNYLDDNYHYIFEINFKVSNLETGEEDNKIIMEVEDTSFYKPRIIEVFNIEKLLGEEITEKPMYIKDIKQAGSGVCICGEVKRFNELMTKEKIDNEGKTKPSRPYFKWVLEDFTGRINVLTFCSEANLPKIRKISDGSKLLMFGDVQEDSFSKGFTFRPKHISFCELPQEFEEVINYKPVPENYKCVKLEPAQVINQMDLFNYQSRVYPEYIKTHTIVVYDFETSGLSSASDSVIEIGAVKIVNGEYTDKFNTFVHYDRMLPKEIVELTTITDDDLKNAPSEADAFADFYKFCDGCVLCGYNSDNFDLLFLKRIWKAHNYEFKHETLDCYKLALKVVHGLRKYTLVSISEYLKINLSNAHRAIADATATAEVLLTISKDVF